VLLLEGEMMYLGGTSFSTGMTHGRSDMVVYAIEKTTPKVIWSVYLGGTSTEETLHAMASNGTQLYVSGSTVLGAFETTIFSTLDKSNGNLVWTKKLGNTETVVVKKIGMMGDLVFGVGFSV
jgi:outer membrane protein assembly factor BamB